MATFKDLSLSPEILAVLDALGFTEPTEIQSKAIPLLLSEKKIDFHGQAQTGTGKTLAFGLPLLQKIDKSRKVPQALIVAPTRELAVQIYESLEKIGSKVGVSLAVIYGGVSMEEQIYKLKRGVQIVVGTPGRINDHLRKKTLAAGAIETLVLDEADIMLDMGFKDDVEETMRYLPKDRQIWLFSATVKAGIADIMKKHMQDPVSVRVTPKMVTAQRTKQYYCIVPFRSRVHAITRFIQATSDFYGFIFCQTKILTSEVAEELVKRGYNVAALHGDLSQTQRNAVIKKFKNRAYTILVATDVAARGIDVPDITHVINYSVPDDLEGYVHRIGRTGRAGKEGIAITFISKSEQRTIQHLERKFSVRIEPIDVPSREVVLEKRMAEIPAYMHALESKKIPEQEQLEKFIKNVAPEDLKKMASQLLYDKFFATLDLEEIPYTHVEGQEIEQFQEIYINVGAEDGVTKDMVRDFLFQTPVIKPENIMTIRVIKRRSFVKLSADCSPDLVSSLRGKLLDGRKVHVNVTCLIGQQVPQTHRRSEGSFRRRGRR
jgi:ATP-dependent RNA helicase DeaD